MLEILYYIFIFPLESGMKFVLVQTYNIFNNYGISIVLMSLAVNIALLPLYYLAEHWQGKEREIRNKMQPELDKINNAFKGEKRYYYTKAVYKRFNYHPISSIRVSFGFLIQVPFFIAAYHFLSHYEGVAGIPFLFINDLSQPDKLLKFKNFAVNILPFVMTIINILSAYIYTKNLRKSDKIQLWLLALLFLLLLYNLSSALVLYWTFNNIFSLIKNTLSVHVFKIKSLT